MIVLFLFLKTFLTPNVTDCSRMGPRAQPDGLVPVDDVAGETEVVEVEDVRVPLLRPNEKPL